MDYLVLTMKRVGESFVADDKFTGDDLIKDRWLRLRTLYYIVNKDGNRVKFEPNWAQQDFFDNLWYRNIILKGRQLGFSTAASLFLLDHCLFTRDAHVGIIGSSWNDVKKLFERVKFAYNNLPDKLKALIYPVRDSQTELMLSNGSSLRVGLSMRGATLSMLHISEFGKICAEFPEKAKEVMTGAIEAVPAKGIIIIESTAEGQDGYFFNLCQQAQENMRDKIKLSTLDYRFHFYPWYKHDEYKIDEAFYIPPQLGIYYDKLEKMGITLSPSQQVWYAKKMATLGDTMKSEYPSTSQEAWEGSQEGLIYGPQMVMARSQNRLCHIPYDRSNLVHCALDLGFSDETAIVWFQVIGKEIRFIDYYQDSGRSLQEYIEIIRGKPYQYGKYFAPHDIDNHELSTGFTRREFARRLGIEFSVVPRCQDLMVAIDHVRNLFNRVWIDTANCKELIKCLDNYKKRWVSSGYWAKEPVHNSSSHGADSLRCALLGLDYLVDTGLTPDERKQVNYARQTKYL